MTSRVRNLCYRESSELALDAKIVAIRWDLLEWSIVIDIDYVSTLKSDSGKIGRAWMVFSGVSAIWCPMNESRLVNGIFSTHELTKNFHSDEYDDFTFSLLLPTFDKDDNLSGNPHGELKIRAMSLHGLASVDFDTFGNLGPNYTQRQKLASDQELINAFS